MWALKIIWHKKCSQVKEWMIKLTDVGDTKQSSLLMNQYLIKELYTYYNKRDKSAYKINSEN